MWLSACRADRFERGYVPLCRALGPQNVLAVTIPYKTSSDATRSDSQAVVDQLGVQTLDVPITAQIDAYFAQVGAAPQLRLANKCARERMAVLYDQSAAFGGLVAGTSNKSELLLGYGTQFGGHGVGHQSGRRPLQDAALRSGRLSGRAQAHPLQRADRRPLDRPRPTRASWAFRMPRSIGCWC